jgi:hypothetical protein
MEDRDTRVLHLELVDLPLDDYLATRGRDLLSRDGVTGLSCWENLSPSRTDLPRRLDEFGWLAVFECDEAFVAPEQAPGIAGLTFVRTARPGQGHLGGGPTMGLLLVLISPKRSSEADDLRSWADLVHIRHIAATSVPGYTMITPYQLVAGGLLTGDAPRFLHLYEMETPDAEAAYQSMTPLVAERLGGYETDAFQGWANHPALLIDYVSTFRRLRVEP